MKHGEKIAERLVVLKSLVLMLEKSTTKNGAPKGTRKYNKDAFIVIKNLDRNPTISSQPNPEGEFKPQHGINTTK